MAFVLNWMDSLTCLTAEKVTLRSMVTAQLSDLHFKGQAYLGMFLFVASFFILIIQAIWLN